MGNKSNRIYYPKRRSRARVKKVMSVCFSDADYSSVPQEIADQNSLCAICGIKFDRVDPLAEGNARKPLSLKDPLYEPDSISVSAALDAIFRVKLPRKKIIDACSICHLCAGVLRDLYVLWNSFVDKISQRSRLFPYLRKGSGENLDSLPIASRIPPRTKKRLRAKIARRESDQKRDANHSDESNDSYQEMGVVCKIETDENSDMKLDDGDDGIGRMHHGRYCDNGSEEPNDSNSDNKHPELMPEENGESIVVANKQDDSVNAKRKSRRHKQKLDMTPFTSGPSPASDLKPDFAGEADQREELQITRQSLRKRTKRCVSTTFQDEGDDDLDNDASDKDTDFCPEDYEGDVGPDILWNRKRRILRDQREAAKERKTNGPTGTSKKFICDSCGRRFKLEAGLKFHVTSVHLKIRGPFICDIDNCGKKFKASTELECHKNSHSGIKPFVCHYCGWATTGDKLLKRHFEKHLDPEVKEELKTKVCHVCGAKFMRRSDLMGHLIVHSDDRPFHCPYEGCTSKFKLRPKLRDHINVIHLDLAEKLTCDRCGRVFVRKDALKAHYDRHAKYDLLGVSMRKSRDPPTRDSNQRVDLAAAAAALASTRKSLPKPTHTTTSSLEAD